MPPRCYLGCSSDVAGHLHVFPNPNRFPEQFQKWVEIVGGQLNTPEDFVFFRMKRLCDRHFTDQDRNRNNRLNALAIPSLFLTGESVGRVTKPSNVSMALSEIDINVPLQSTQTNNINKEILEEAATTNETIVEHENFSAAYADTLNCISAPEVLSDEPAQRSNPSVQTSETFRTYLGSGTFVLSEHNYSKTQYPKAHHIAALDLSNKQPSLSIKKYGREQRQIRLLKQQIKSLRKRCTSFKNRLASATKISTDAAFEKVTKTMTTPAKLFTKMQLSQTHKKPSGRRFSLEEKILSLSLFKRSPKCYSLLAHCFTLPSKKTLKGLLSQIKLGPGLNEKIFVKLTKTVREMSVENRLCTLIFDEMCLTPQINYDLISDQLKGFVSTNINENRIADHVLVFMIKGIKTNFKQPVAYYFTNSMTKYELKSLILEVLQKVQATGLIPLCSICDQSTVNVGAINLLVNNTKTKFLRQGKEWRHDFYYVNRQKIIPLYDVPHLLKGLRNNLITKDLVYVDADDEQKQKIVKWEYFRNIYEADKTFGELRLLNKITEEHIIPEKIKKMRVKTAAQIFSHSVAVVAEHLTARGILNAECRQLIPFVSFIDKLFDSLNSNTFHIPNGKIYKGCVKRSSPHHKLWTKAKVLLKSMKFIAKKKTGNKIRLVTCSTPSINNFVKTIEGFEALWNTLSNKYSFDCMLTRHFNQDPIENFFGNIRSYGARNNSPNVVAFEGAFKALLLNNYNSPHSINSNCEKDENVCLQTIDFFLTEKQKEASCEDVPEENVVINEDILKDREVESDMGQRNYVCGWVIKKCLKNIVKGCVTCKTKLISSEDKVHDYIKLKEYNKNKKWLVYPSEEIICYFYEIQRTTISFLQCNVPKASLRSKVKLIINTFNDFPCDCLTHKDLLKEHFQNNSINIFINSWCRDINRILLGKVSYEGVDELKKAAQMYHNKHKHFKQNK